jgi:[ribosomal protein S5]-alanine N-acetyltransferase
LKTRKNIFLDGETIYLRPLNDIDLKGNYQVWLNDKAIVEYNSHGRFPMTIDKLNDFVKSLSGSNTTLVLAIIDKASDQHIGNISLQGINWIDRSAEIAFLLGEKNFWGKGVMYEAGKLLIKHGFYTLNLHRIHCGTSSENTGMHKLAQKLGMQKEGVRRQAIFKNNCYFDIIEFGLLKEEVLLFR